MTTVTVKYLNQVAYVGNRPYAEVELFGPAGASTGLFLALVDTGADYLTLPASYATSVGLALVGSPTSIATASGSSSGTLVRGISVEIEGQAVKVDVLFATSSATPELLGRDALLAAMEPGFNPSTWLWR